MKLLITGVTGFIGSHIIEHLSSKESDLSNIALFVRDIKKVSYYEASGARIFTGDVVNYQSVNSSISHFQPDAIIHSAALADDWAPFSELKRVNVEGTENILRSLHQLDSRAFFVHISSSGVYGKVKKADTTYITENTPFNPKANYQKSKALAEHVIQEYIKKGIKASIIRPPIVIGPRDFTQFYKIYQAIKEGKFPFINGGKAVMTMVDVQDLVDAIFCMIEKRDIAEGQVYNIKSFEISVKELYDYIVPYTGYDKPPKSYSYRLAYLAGYFSEMKGRLLGKPSTLNRYRVVKFGKNRLFNTDKIKADLSFSPHYDAKTSVEKTINWIKSEELE